MESFVVPADDVANALQAVEFRLAMVAFKDVQVDLDFRSM